jgi:tRNA G10  N-methylase Trm11
MGNFFSLAKEITPQIAEPKEEIIQQLQKQIEILENRNSFLIKNLLSRSDEINYLKETNSDYLARLVRLEHEKNLAVLQKNELAKEHQEFIEVHEREQKIASEMVQNYKRRYTAYKECFAASEEENQNLRKKLKLSEAKEEHFISESSK